MARVRAVIEHHQGRGALVAEPAERAVLALIGPLLMAAVLGRSSDDSITDANALVKDFLGGRRL